MELFSDFVIEVYTYAGTSAELGRLVTGVEPVMRATTTTTITGVMRQQPLLIRPRRLRISANQPFTLDTRDLHQKRPKFMRFSVALR